MDLFSSQVKPPTRLRALRSIKEIGEGRPPPPLNPAQPLKLFPYPAPRGQDSLDAVLIIRMLSRRGSQQGFGSDWRGLAVVVSKKEPNETPQEKIALILLNAGTNSAVRLIDPDPRLSNRPIFSHDGKMLLYSITENGVSNLWAQPINGSPGHQMTNFFSELIGFYELTPDGKSLVLHRPTWIRTSFYNSTTQHS